MRIHEMLLFLILFLANTISMSVCHGYTIIGNLSIKAYDPTNPENHNITKDYPSQEKIEIRAYSKEEWKYGLMAFYHVKGNDQSQKQRCRDFEIELANFIAFSVGLEDALPNEVRCMYFRDSMHRREERDHSKYPAVCIESHGKMLRSPTEDEVQNLLSALLETSTILVEREAFPSWFLSIQDKNRYIYAADAYGYLTMPWVPLHMKKLLIKWLPSYVKAVSRRRLTEWDSNEVSAFSVFFKNLNRLIKLANSLSWFLPEVGPDVYLHIPESVVIDLNQSRILGSVQASLLGVVDAASSRLFMIRKKLEIRNMLANDKNSCSEHKGFSIEREEQCLFRLIGNSGRVLASILDYQDEQEKINHDIKLEDATVAYNVGASLVWFYPPTAAPLNLVTAPLVAHRLTKLSSEFSSGSKQRKRKIIDDFTSGIAPFAHDENIDGVTLQSIQSAFYKAVGY